MPGTWHSRCRDVCPTRDKHGWEPSGQRERRGHCYHALFVGGVYTKSQDEGNKVALRSFLSFSNIYKPTVKSQALCSAERFKLTVVTKETEKETLVDKPQRRGGVVDSHRGGAQGRKDFTGEPLAGKRTFPFVRQLSSRG